MACTRPHLTRLDDRAVPAGGLSAGYCAAMDLTGPAVARVAPHVDSDWGNGSPAAGRPADRFSGRWAGHRHRPVGRGVHLPHRQRRRRPAVGGRPGGDRRWTDHGTRADTAAPVAQAAGRTVPVRMGYHENGGRAVARFRWQAPGSAGFVAVPASALTPAASGRLGGTPGDDVGAGSAVRADGTLVAARPPPWTPTRLPAGQASPPTRSGCEWTSGPAGPSERSC
jgi:hypothetical protein